MATENSEFQPLKPGEFINTTPYLSAMNDLFGLTIPYPPIVFVGQESEDFKPLISELKIPFFHRRSKRDAISETVKRNKAVYIGEFNTCVILPDLTAPNIAIAHELSEAFLAQIGMPNLHEDLQQLVKTRQNMPAIVERSIIRDTAREGIATWMPLMLLSEKPELGKHKEARLEARNLFGKFMQNRSQGGIKDEYERVLNGTVQRVAAGKIEYTARYRDIKYHVGYLWVENFMKQRQTEVTLHQAFSDLLTSIPESWDELKGGFEDIYPKTPHGLY